MPSQQEEAEVQAASDAYVTAHNGALLSETDVIHHYSYKAVLAVIGTDRNLARFQGFASMMLIYIL